ncbi:collagen alpha-1(XII) chain isoform X1 [Takifugu rubripes]|uniref:collagen alpha-1(XII) chain isoform X1 n=1 Tax=Takifugu rubripes TaxID=31033 RepID=UPI001145DDAC|nr:collagen alpha-1(XII) chain isoform X1 [Takifugu rubripes]
MKRTVSLAAAALLALLLSTSSRAQDQVEPPSDLRFKILKENSVQMSWNRPRSRIQGYRIQVSGGPEEPTKEFTLPPSATKTSISDLSADVDYVVTISAFAGSEESLPISGQITLESAGSTRGSSRKPDVSDQIKCSAGTVADVLFLVDGSWSVGRANFKYIRSFISATASAFQIGQDKTRVGVVQYGSDARVEFNLNTHLSRPALLRAIGSLPYKGGDTMTGQALNFLLENSLTEEAGSRKDFPSVLVVITDGKSEDPVEQYAKKLRSRGVEVFVLGVGQTDEAEMKLIASTPYRNHIYSVATFDTIKKVQRELISQVCAGVEEQLNSLVSGEEAIEPASNLQVLEVASKSMRVTWDPSIGQVSGYKVQMIPMMADSKRQEVYVGVGQTSVVVRDLSPDVEYQISLYALKGLTPSEPITVMQKTEPVKVSLECSLGVDVQADVVLLVDGSYSIGLANFAKVRAFLEVLVNTFDIGPDKVQISLVQYSRDPHTEFYLNTHNNLEAVITALRTFPYRGGSTNTGKAMTYVRKTVFQTNRGARANVPRVTILITDGKSSDTFQEPAANLRNTDVEIFAVGVKDAVRSELEAIANAPAETHVYTVEDFDAFQRISKELTQSICLRIEQELQLINQRRLVQPQDLSFSDVGPRSFRTSWQINADNVESYLVQFKPEGEDTHYVSMSVPGDVATALLPYLTPLTRYEVSVSAHYASGTSLPVTGYGTTTEERGSVQNIKVTEESAQSFRVSWRPAPGDVARYKLTYEPAGDESSKLETFTVGPELTVVLQDLLPQTTYRVSVTPEYQGGPGVAQQTDGTTTEAKGSPRGLRVFDETVSSMKVSWEPAPGNVLQYRLAYRPSSGGPRHEVSVKGTNTAAVLKKLQPGTEYDISVSARYRSGLGEALTGQGTTLGASGPPKNLVTSDVTDTSFTASWTAAPGNVKMYQVKWKSMFSEENGEMMVPGDITNAALKGLSPETLFQVSVVANYEDRDSEALTGREATDAPAAHKKLVVSDETEQTMKVTWAPAPGGVSHYRLKHVPGGGGKEVVLKVPGSVTSAVLKRLQPVTTYNITVEPIYKHGEGKARQGVGTTLSPFKAPRNLHTSEPTKTSFRVSWDPAPGDVKGYKVTFHPMGNDVDLGELLVGPYDSTVVLEELRAGTKYSVAVVGMFEGGQSLPLAGEERTTLSDAPDPPFPDYSDARCKTNAKADIILLVDGSWSIGRLNFKTIRNFIARTVSVFDIGPQRVQIGLAQYSGDPKTEWHLNAHPNRESLLKAVSNLPYKGGNTMTGMALNYILQNNFRTNVGMRPEARKIGVLITDGKSQDDVVFNSQNLRDSGIELYAIGIKNADENELRSIASDPDQIHMYNVNDFKFLVDIVDDVTNNLCNSVKGPGGELEPPSDLVTFDQTHHSFHVSWTTPDGHVERFLVTYTKTAGGPVQELVVDGSASTVLLDGLTPLTEYQVSVYSVIGETRSEPLKGIDVTLPLPSVKVMNVYDETSSSMWVTWGSVEGATGYVLLYRPINEPQLEKEVRLGGDATDIQLKQLTPETEYSITLRALFEEAVSDPLEGKGLTLPVPPAGNLRISDVTHSRMKLSWDPAPGQVSKYIITYKPDEGDLKEVEVSGEVTTQDLSGLISQTEYDVAVTPVYTGGSGTPMLGNAITEVVPAPKNLQFTEVTQTSFRTSWEHGAPDVALYRLSWSKRGENDYQYAILNNDETSYELENLDTDTEYDVKVTAIYSDEAESEDLLGITRTLLKSAKVPPAPPRNLKVFNATTSSLTAKWDPAPGPVQSYRVTYRPAPGGEPLMLQIGGKKTSVVLSKLQPDTRYSVSVAALYPSGASRDISTDGRTNPLGGVRNLQVLNPTMTTLNVRWEPAEGRVKEYKVIYAPAAGGAESVEKVSAGTSSTILRSLQPDTVYTVSLVPVYAEGDGKTASENGKTRALAGVKNLRVTDPTMTSLAVNWDPADGAVRLYKVFYVPVTGGLEEMEQVPTGTTNIILRNLSPDTPYRVSVLPVYPAREGKRQSEMGRTLPLSGVGNMKVTNPTITTLTVNWNPADGNVQGYKVIYVPEDGGEEVVEMVSESTTRTVLSNLLPNTRYSVTVVPVYAEGDGPSLSDSGKTKPRGSVRNLQVYDPTSSKLKVRWEPAEGNVREYVITWVPTTGGDPTVTQVSGSTTSTVLQNLDPDTEYTVTVVPVYPEMEGISQSEKGKTNPMGGVKNLQVVDPTFNSLKVCWDPAVGNVRSYKVFYTANPDGETEEEEVSGGTTSTTLRNLDPDTVYDVVVVPIYPDVEGIRQAEKGKTRSLSGVKNLQVTDPTTNSLRVRWEPAEGDVRTYNIFYVPTNGGAERAMQVSGMSTSTVLRDLQPDTKYTVTLVPVYTDLEGKRSSANGKTKPLGGVKNLQVTDPTTSSLKVRWDPAEGNVRQYRIFYVPTAGGAEDMEQVSGGTTSTVLRNLLSDTAYTVTVVPVYPEGEGLRQSDAGKTLPRTPPRNIQVYNPTPDSLKVRWEPASGQVQQYRVAYSALRGTARPESILVPGNLRSAFLDNLIPDTPYSVSVSALYADGEGSPVRDTGKTLPRAGPRNMRVFDPTTSSLTLSWDHAEGPVRQYKISYSPMTGDANSRVEITSVPGNRNNARLENLLPDTPYSITVEPLYLEGPGAELSGTGRTVALLSPRNLRVSDEWYTRFRVAWDPVSAPVEGYRLSYSPAGSAGPPVDLFVGDITSYTLHNLQPGTTYDVKAVAQYTGGKSGPLAGQGTTLYLNVTNIETYKVDHDKFCIKWTPHRSATSYRIKLNPVNPSSRGQQEITISAGLPQYCFDGLSSDALYNATVFVQTPNLEGPGVSIREKTLVKPTPVPTLPPTPSPPPTIPPAWAVCRGAKADLVFVIDGSWSIGEDSFTKVIHFVSGIIGAFDIVGPSGMQVSFVQYSDDAKTEFKLNSYRDKGVAMAALHLIRYQGGNTKTGMALKHTYEKAFSVGNGMRRNVPKLVVAITDGRSQDEVKKSAAKLQQAGYSVFAIGVADVDFNELQEIATKPSERHVFVVDDFDAFDTIKENLINFICETATSSCPLIFLNGFTSPGFRMLEAFNLTEKTYSYAKGVSMEPGSFNSFTSYRIHKNAFLTQPSTDIHPDGLPHAYTIILMFRLLPESPAEAFDIWQVSSKDHKPETGVTINPSRKTISFYNKDERGETQRVVFDGDQVKRIFHGSFHKLHILVSSTGIKLNIDCQEVAEKEIKAAGNTSSDGYQVLGRMSKSIGATGESATFQLQMFDIVCSLGWTSRDRCCDLPSMRDELKCPALPNACSCTSAASGQPGPQGPVGAPGSKGSRGERGEQGSVGPMGPRGEMGPPGPMGLPGPQGPSGLSIPGEPGRPGPKGDVGDGGLPGQKGSPGAPGAVGPVGPAGVRGPQGKDGAVGPRGPPGPMGPPGTPGIPGTAGKPGNTGDTGSPGGIGQKGDKGERGDFAPQNMMRAIARQVCENLLSAQMTRVNSLLNQIPSGMYSSNNPGPPGPPGLPGRQGPRGEPGSAGRSGFPGNPGLPGQQGDRGPPGEKGDRGESAVGQKGPRGPAGPPGESRTGSPGPPGSTGPRGPPGRPGYAGVRGPPGPPGYCDSSQCVGIPYNGQGYGAGQYPPQPDTRVVPVRQDQTASQNRRRKRSLSRKAT